MKYFFLLWAFMLSYALARDVAYFKLIKRFHSYLRAKIGEPQSDDSQVFEAQE